MTRPLPAVHAVPLEEFPTAYPHVRFAVRFPDGREIAHDAGARHPLAGTGKLVLAGAVARLAAQDPGLLGDRLTLTADHRAAARSGTLRAMSSELELTVDDAMALIVGTGDGACAMAVLEHLTGRGIDVLDVARGLVAELGLADTEITGLEGYADHGPGAAVGTSKADATDAAGAGAAGASWGEGLVGETTPADLCTLLSRLPDSVLGWMGKAFEPAGLASALPGFGPRTIEHHTLSGFELDAPAGAPGCASVLVLPAGVGDPPVVAAAYHPARHDGGRPVPGLEVTTALGTLGLAVVRSSGMPIRKRAEGDR